MSAGVYNVICEQGSSFRLDLTYTNDDGSPIHLAGFKAQMDIRRSHTTNSRLISQLSTENGRIQVPTPETGEILLAIPSEDTAELPSGEFFYDLIVWQDIPDGMGGYYKESRKVIEGKFVVRAGVTVL